MNKRSHSLENCYHLSDLSAWQAFKCAHTSIRTCTRTHNTMNSQKFVEVHLNQHGKKIWFIQFNFDARLWTNLNLVSMFWLMFARIMRRCAIFCSLFNDLCELRSNYTWHGFIQCIECGTRLLLIDKNNTYTDWLLVHNVQFFPRFSSFVFLKFIVLWNGFDVWHIELDCYYCLFVWIITQ